MCPAQLTSRYGGSYVFSVTTPPQEMAAVGDLVKSLSPGARLVYAVSGTQRFELPTEEVSRRAMRGNTIALHSGEPQRLGPSCTAAALLGPSSWGALFWVLAARVPRSVCLP